jgi:hypothetical protein
METQLIIALDVFARGIPIRYVSQGTPVSNTKRNEIYIEKYKIDTCPNEHQIISSLQKRIGRSDAFKSQKYTLAICILLLLSKGYCITSSTLIGIEDSFIERCWECIHVTSHNIPKNLSTWIQTSMEKRSASAYSILFCRPKAMILPTNLLQDSISGSGKFLNIDTKEFGIPNMLWHRDDAIRYTMILHMKLQNRDFP